MNQLLFVQTGGYPLKAERLQEIQEAYNIFNAFGNLAGDLTIISGCEPIGDTISNGVIYINGEAIDFKQGYLEANSTVIIIEESTEKEFENGQIKAVYKKRYATFGTAETSFPWADFKRPFQTKNIPSDLVARLENLEKKTAVFQSGGGMVLWNKPANQIPQGWQEVVDWRGRIPVGLDEAQDEFKPIGKTGGAKSKTLAVSEIPSHSHHKPGSVFDSFVAGAGAYGNNSSAGENTDAGDNSQIAIGNLFTNYNAGGAAKELPVGGGQPFSVLNPYRVVMFIEYIG